MRIARQSVGDSRLGLLRMRYGRSKRGFLLNVSNQIKDLDKVVALQLSKCYQTPDALWGCLLGENAVLPNDVRTAADS